MKIRYRFLEGKRPSNELKDIFGMAYTGFLSSNLNAIFLSKKMYKTIGLGKPLEDITEKNLKGIFEVHSYKFGEIHEIEIPDNNEEWTPDELIVEQMKYWDSINMKQKRQIA